MDSVDEARGDLDAFREWKPGWFPSFTSRFTANFLHERLWAALVARVDSLTRNALDKPVWVVAVTRGTGNATGITWAPVDPSLPDFDLSQVVDQPSTEPGDAT